MHVIYPDKISSADSQTEDGSWPIANILDNHPKKVWKSDGSAATEIITLAVAALAEGLGMHAIQGATSVSIVISDGMGLDFGSVGATAVLDKGAVGGVDVVDLPETDTSPQSGIFDLDPDSVGALWVQYDSAKANVHRVDITLTAAAAVTFQVGVVTAGVLNQFADPFVSRGLQAGLHSYSINEELNNGSKYINVKDIVRTFGFTIFVDRDTDFYTFMRTFAQRNGETPASWRIISEIEDWEFVVFAMLDGMPEGDHAYPVKSAIRVNLLEVI